MVVKRSVRRLTVNVRISHPNKNKKLKQIKSTSSTHINTILSCELKRHNTANAAYSNAAFNSTHYDETIMF